MIARGFRVRPPNSSYAYGMMVFACADKGSATGGFLPATDRAPRPTRGQMDFFNSFHDPRVDGRNCASPVLSASMLIRRKWRSWP